MAFLPSCSPPSIFLTSPASTLAARSSRPAREVVLHRFTLPDPVAEDAEVLRLPPQRFREIAVVLQPAAVPRDFLRAARTVHVGPPVLRPFR